MTLGQNRVALRKDIIYIKKNKNMEINRFQGFFLKPMMVRKTRRVHPFHQESKVLFFNDVNHIFEGIGLGVVAYIDLFLIYVLLRIAFNLRKMRINLVKVLLLFSLANLVAICYFTSTNRLQQGTSGQEKKGQIINARPFKVRDDDLPRQDSIVPADTDLSRQNVKVHDFGLSEKTVKVPYVSSSKQTDDSADASLPKKVSSFPDPIISKQTILNRKSDSSSIDCSKSVGNLKRTHTNATIKAPQVHLCISLSAGLGNRLYIFASAYGLAKSKGMKLVVIGGLETLKSAFKMEGDYGTDGKLCDGSLHIRETASCKVSPNIANLPNNKNVSISGYLQSYKYFDSYSHELRRIFTFRDEVFEEAKTKLNQLLSQKYVGDAKIATYNRTLVGIQIRRGDYVTKRFKRYGYKTAPEEYIFKAQDYIRKKYVNVTFVACSNDVKWTQGVLGGQKDAIIAPMGSANVDMALLSLMDHVIITVGTYGYWSAWLNRKNGTVIYYKDFFSPNSAFSREFAHPNTDTYYPHWIGM